MYSYLTPFMGRQALLGQTLSQLLAERPFVA